MENNTTLKKKSSSIPRILRESSVASVVSLSILLTGCAQFNKTMYSIQQFEQGLIQVIWMGNNLNNILKGGYGLLNNNQKLDTSSDYLVVKLSNKQYKLVPVRDSDVKNYRVGEEIKVSINTNIKYPIVVPVSPFYKTNMAVNTIKLHYINNKQIG